MKLRFVQSVDADGQTYWLSEKFSETTDSWLYVTGSIASDKAEGEARFKRLMENGGVYGPDEVLQEVTI